MSDPYFPSLKDIMTAEHTLNDILVPTPLMKNRNLSDKYEANIFLKREDLQMVRSYKIRGAYNKIKSLTPEEMEKGVVCASAGNHAQGVAFSCSKLGIQGKIYMPVTTPRQKINQVKMFGGKSIEVVLTGDTFDQANTAAIEACKKNDMVFIPPFNDPRIIEGQATVGLEIIQEARMKLDYIFVPIGGGGLASGIGSFYKQICRRSRRTTGRRAHLRYLQKSIGRHRRCARRQDLYDDPESLQLRRYRSRAGRSPEYECSRLLQK